jgi:hypothetical protein
MAGVARSLSNTQLEELDERFQHEPAEAVVAWAVQPPCPTPCSSTWP